MFTTYTIKRSGSFRGTLNLHLGGKTMKRYGVANYKTYKKIEKINYQKTITINLKVF